MFPPSLRNHSQIGLRCWQKCRHVLPDRAHPNPEAALAIRTCDGVITRVSRQDAEWLTTTPLLEYIVLHDWFKKRPTRCHENSSPKSLSCKSTIASAKR